MRERSPENPPGAGLDEVVEVLGPEGSLARAIPDYEDRPEQRRMAQAVTAALAEDRIVIVEAGTGTGKTLAYLVPALLSRMRVVVATGTRTLQDQITRHDLPLLEQILPSPFAAVALKGVANYLCRRKWHEAANQGDLFRHAERDLLAEWVEHTETGDRAEVNDLADDAPIWQAVTTTSDSRLGPRCPFYDECFVTRARRRADKADLILVNHHLFFADLALRAARPGARVLPEYDAVIFDEAHLLEDVMTEHFGIAVSTTRLSRLVHDARHAFGDPDGPFRHVSRPFTDPPDAMAERTSSERQADGERIAEAVEHAAELFFERLRQHIVAIAQPDSGRVELAENLFTDPVHQDAWFALDNAVDELARHTFSEAEAHLAANPEADVGTAAHAGTAEPATDREDDERAEMLLSVARRAGVLRDDLAALAEQSADTFVYWGEVAGTGVSLCGAPIHIAPYVQREIVGNVARVVLTSATLRSAGSFDYLRTRLGLASDIADELAVTSPFDYPEQVMLYLPRDLPDPRDPGFVAAVCRRVRELLAITEGRALVLFTAHRSLRQAARILGRDTPYPLLVQGQLPRATLLERFRQRPGSVLLATGSFWQGIDIPGDALQLVIIDKLPFAPPTDPLIAARMRAVEARGGDPFADYQLPQAALALEQGFGRLIRRCDDRGIVAILDRRVLVKLYGRVFLDSLPPDIPRTSALEQLRRWWRRAE